MTGPGEDEKDRTGPEGGTDPVASPPPARPATRRASAARAAIGTPVPAAPELPAAPAPEPVPAAAGEPEAPPAAPGPAAAPGARPAPVTPDIAAAVDDLVVRLRGQYRNGELVAGIGALLILGISWLLVGVIAGDRSGAGSTIVILAAAGTLGVLWLRGRKDPPAWASDPLVLNGLALLAGATLVVDGLVTLRTWLGGWRIDPLEIVWWVGAALIAAGAWLEHRGTRRP